MYERDTNTGKTGGCWHGAELIRDPREDAGSMCYLFLYLFTTIDDKNYYAPTIGKFQYKHIR